MDPDFLRVHLNSLLSTVIMDLLRQLGLLLHLVALFTEHSFDIKGLNFGILHFFIF